MNKLSNKFMAGISLILGMLCICSLMFISYGLEKFYLYQKKHTMIEVSDAFLQAVREGASYEEALNQIEKSDQVIIAAVASQNMTADAVNDELRAAFQNKGIGFQKYWLWEEDYRHILDGEHRIRLYQQEHLNYSLLVEYMQLDQQLFAVTMIIPNIADAFGIIYPFLILVNVIGIAVAAVFMLLYIKKITKPLHEFEIFASHMKENTFVPIQVQTADELQIAADSLNVMGEQLIKYQDSLQEKNRQMEQLLNDVAHDLKTPISLIQLYITGIQDGMDDGTFLNTILSKNRDMADMVDQLLFVSRIKNHELKITLLHLSDLLQQLIKESTLLAQERSIVFQCDIAEDIMMESAVDLMKSLFMNLITNAVKYSSGPQIEIQLLKDKNEIVFFIRNETDMEVNINEIWKPYYVGEQSRNKLLSGSGLGLVIVKNICDRLHYEISCSIKDKEIIFQVVMPCSQCCNKL